MLECRCIYLREREKKKKKQTKKMVTYVFTIRDGSPNRSSSSLASYPLLFAKCPSSATPDMPTIAPKSPVVEIVRRQREKDLINFLSAQQFVILCTIHRTQTTVHKHVDHIPHASSQAIIRIIPKPEFPQPKVRINPSAYRLGGCHSHRAHACSYSFIR